MSTVTITANIDVRETPPRERHALIFSTFQAAYALKLLRRKGGDAKMSVGALPAMARH